MVATQVYYWVAHAVYICFTGIAGYMRKPRTLVPIPAHLAAAIDKLAGQRQRARFIVELLERELRRREQRDALGEAAGSWDDKDHPELAEGGDKWIREMRRGSIERLDKIERQRKAG